MAKPGKKAKMTVRKASAEGWILEDQQSNVALLPAREAGEIKEGEEVEVFVYQDNNKNWLASRKMPYLQLGEIAPLKVVSSSGIGAFLDWGLPKDLFLPKAEQREEVIPGRKYAVALYWDERSGRLAASTRLEKFLRNDKLTVKEKDEVELIVWYASDMGYNVVINQRHRGLLHFSDVHKRIKSGDRLKGYIKKIREGGKVDVILQPEGYEKIEDSALQVLKILEEAGGTLPVGDKSDPEEIKRIFGMSKKTFKKAIGSLYKQKRISIEPDSIRLM